MSSLLRLKYNRHREQGITSCPIRALEYNIELTHQSSDWMTHYSLWCLNLYGFCTQNAVTLGGAEEIVALAYNSMF